MTETRYIYTCNYRLARDFRSEKVENLEMRESKDGPFDRSIQESLAFDPRARGRRYFSFERRLGWRRSLRRTLS